MAHYTSRNMTFIGDFAQEAARLTANLRRSWAGDELRPNQIEDLVKAIWGVLLPSASGVQAHYGSAGDLHMCRSRRFRQQKNARRHGRGKAPHGD